MARKITYNEWWFTKEAPEFKYNKNSKWFKFSKPSLKAARLRNLSLSFELSETDEIVSPTVWQSDQLPEVFREKVNVIHEGVDLDFSNTILLGGILK